MIRPGCVPGTRSAGGSRIAGCPALYRQAAALGDHKARKALATFNNFVWPDQSSRDICLSRVEHYVGTVNGCQATAYVTRTTVTCLVPIIDWNPRTWEGC